MKPIIRHILIWLFLLNGMSTFASHVLGGEISYKHIKDNQYKITLSIYRDCNGCKINGTGGGSSLEDCSEIDYLFVKGVDKSTSKETKFSLTRESITDMSPVCRTKISACKSNSNSIFGIELHKFTTTVDLDNSKIAGFCDYYLYVSFAERNNNITTGQASQNFCIDAYIKTCLNVVNNSSDFVVKPAFIVNGNKKQLQGFFSIDSDDDSLVYKLTPALTDLNKEANYGTGFSYLNPLTPNCVDFTCTPNKNQDPPIGFYFDNNTGEAIFMPTRDGERAVVAVKVEEYRKISGKWELLGYIKRDILLYVKTSDGNNAPQITSKEYFEICEEEPFELKIEATDGKNSLSMAVDTVNFELLTPYNGVAFSKISHSNAPFNYGLFKWTPPKQASNGGKYSFLISAIDNSCPLNAVSSKLITIKVNAKEAINLKYADLGCGNYEVNSSNIHTKSKLFVQIFTSDGSKEIFKTSKILDTISFLPKGKYISRAFLTNEFGCQTLRIDTIDNNPKPQGFLTGDSAICSGTLNDYLIINLLNRKSKIEWFYDSKLIGKGSSLNTSFSHNGLLLATLQFQKGKWYCSDSLSKPISIISLPEITLPDKIVLCHNSGKYDLTALNAEPSGGKWFSTSPFFNNGIVNTAGTSYYVDDTLEVYYELNIGCKSQKKINIILAAIPEFELSSISICEMKTPVRFLHLIKKPYKIIDYSYQWGLQNNPQNIKDDKGYQVVFPSDLGDGYHQYFGEITGKNGCKAFDTATLQITPAIKIKVQNPIVLCQGSGLLNINKMSGISPHDGNWSFYDFELFKNKEFILTDSCGIFEVTYVYDNYGCFDSKKIPITIICKPAILSNITFNKICDDQLPLTLFANPFGGKWEGAYVSNALFNPPLSDQTKHYSIQYKISENQCEFKNEWRIEINPSPKLDLIPEKLTYCDLETIDFSGSVSNANQLITKFNGIEDIFKINNPETFTQQTLAKVKFLNSGTSQTFLLKASNLQGCFSSKEIVFDVFDKPVISGLKDTAFCDGKDFTLTPLVKYDGKDALKFNWIENSVEFSDKLVLKNKKFLTGIHLLNFVVSTHYCKDSKSVNILIRPKPKVDFVMEPSLVTSITQPEFQFWNRSEPNLNWLWNFGTFNTHSTSTLENPNYSYSDTGSYMVELIGTNEYGCTNSVTKTAIVRPDILVFIPNAFTPDNKGSEKNNVFSVSIDNYSAFKIEIFDRWGHKMYISENPLETWDGKSGNVECMPDVYFYYIKVSSQSGRLYEYKGTITLIR